MERSSQLQEIRARQEKWLRERQAEMDRERVVSELRADSMGGPGSAGKASCCRCMGTDIGCCRVCAHTRMRMHGGRSGVHGRCCEAIHHSRCAHGKQGAALATGQHAQRGPSRAGWLLTTMRC